MKYVKKILFLMFFPLLSLGQDFTAENVKTALIRAGNADFSYPVCRLGEVLKLEFDVLDDDYSALCYSIKHCDAFFEPDDLSFSEFAEGFENRRIDTYENSFNTMQNFTHYTLTLPNNDVTLTISGNYIIEVFEEDNPENILLKKRFMISDNFDQTRLKAAVKKPFLADYSFDCQQVEVKIDNSTLNVFNPEKYIKVFVMQNRDFSTRRELEISGYSAKEIIYAKNSGGNIFQGGSEFEFADLKDISFKALGIDAIRYDKGIYKYELSPFEPVEVSYTFLEDLNGAYYIKNDRGFSQDLEADYVKVLFRLKYDPFAEGKIYVYGGLTDYRLDNSSEMVLNTESSFWEKELVLKQGLYNFQFVEKNENYNKFLTGSWAETENDYFIAVYTLLPKNRGERLVMYGVVNSLK